MPQRRLPGHPKSGPCFTHDRATTSKAYAPLLRLASFVASGPLGVRSLWLGHSPGLFSTATLLEGVVTKTGKLVLIGSGFGDDSALHCGKMRRRCSVSKGIWCRFVSASCRPFASHQPKMAVEKRIATTRNEKLRSYLNAAIEIREGVAVARWS